MTAVFASVGMGLQTFLIAAFVALPKQFASVYFGVAENSGAPTDENGNKSPTKTTKIVKILVITATVVISFIAMRYVNSRIDAIKTRVIYARRKARQASIPAGYTSSSWVAFPQDATEAQVRTPFMAPVERDSMDLQ
ncbi:hypothetical protein C8T65DRAFT_118080 [Cerioporus squamosus]|nr:hypothetical protein C8T65DRAFT_118080 [Cerioporus squamosus]